LDLRIKGEDDLKYKNQSSTNLQQQIENQLSKNTVNTNNRNHFDLKGQYIPASAFENNG
jgi:hypothetical protein